MLLLLIKSDSGISGYKTNAILCPNVEEVRRYITYAIRQYCGLDHQEELIHITGADGHNADTVGVYTVDSYNNYGYCEGKISIDDEIDFDSIDIEWITIPGATEIELSHNIFL